MYFAGRKKNNNIGNQTGPHWLPLYGHKIQWVLKSIGTKTVWLPTFFKISSYNRSKKLLDATDLKPTHTFTHTHHTPTNDYETYTRLIYQLTYRKLAVKSIDRSMCSDIWIQLRRTHIHEHTKHSHAYMCTQSHTNSKRLIRAKIMTVVGIEVH